MDSKINCSFAQIFDLLIDIKNLLICISHRLLTQYIFTIISAKNEDEGICTIRANSGSLEITYTVPLNLVGGSQVLEADLRLFRSNREVSLRHLFVNTIPTDLIWFIPKIYVYGKPLSFTSIISKKNAFRQHAMSQDSDSSI